MKVDVKNEDVKRQIAHDLINFKTDSNINMELVKEEYLDKLTASITEITEIMHTNPYVKLSEEKQEELYLDISKKYNDTRDMINGFVTKLKMIGTQAKAVSTFLKNSKYTAETLFWGIRLEEYIIDKIDKTKLSNNDEQIFEVPFAEVMMLHTIISQQHFNGLTYDSFLLAKLTLDITEYVKVYNHLNVRLDKLSISIDSWEEGLDIKMD